jgi:hypothetical protein
MTSRHALLGSTLALIVASGAAPLAAQTTTGALSGHVVDAAGRPVVGARVSFESRALFQTRIFITDAKGDYRAQLLPVGTYTLRVSAPDMVGKTAENVRVGVGANLTFDFKLVRIKEQGALVEVVDDFSKVSKTDDKVSFNYSTEELLRLPTSRSFDGALAIAPGVTDYGIRGANHASYNQTLYRINGMDVKDDSGEASTIYQPLPDSIEDIQVVLSALNARNGRSQGGQVNIVTKSGSNTFEASVRTTLDRPSWSTNLPHGPEAGSDASAYEANATESFSRFTDITASGPIIKDRLWFYFGTRLQPSAAGTTRLGWTGYLESDPTVPMSSVVKFPLTTYGNFPDVDSVLTTPGNYPLLNGNPTRNFDLVGDSDYGKIVPHNTQFEKYEGKLTGMLSTNHTLSFTYLFQRTTLENQSGERSNGQYTINQAFMGPQVDKTQAWTLGWDGQLSDKWFIEARYYQAKVRQRDVTGSTQYPIFVQSYLSTGDRNVQVVDPSENYMDNGSGTWFGPFYSMRSSSSITPDERGNRNFTVNVKTYQEAAGSHELDFGGESFRTIHQFGRDRSGERGVVVGGFVYDPVSKQPLYPTFYTADGWNGTESILNEDDYYDLYLHQTMPMWGPGAHMESYYVKDGEARNETQSVWANDTWQISDRFNVMMGLRYNHFILTDTDGRDLCNNAIFEPRFQMKWNPDGKGEKVLSFSAAKLASAYSDEMAANFRSSSWSVRTISGWSGLHDAAGNLLQPSIDSSNSATDNVMGTVSTGVPGALPVTYNGSNMAGVRWVSYYDLINPANYGSPIAIVDTRQTFRTEGLQVPYTLELALGFTRTWDTGMVRVNLVRRDYRKEWISNLRTGFYDPSDPTKYLTLVQDPSGTGPDHPPEWQQTRVFTNSNLKKIFQDVELSWSERITPRLEFAGNYTWSQTTGRYTWDYYSYRDDKLANGLNDSQFAPEGLLSKTQTAHVWLVYTQPVGKGNVSLSLMTNYYTAGLSTLGGQIALNVPDVPGTINGYRTVLDTNSASSSLYYGGLGAYKNGSDSCTSDAKIQATAPLGKKVSFLLEVTITNVFNRIQDTGFYDWRTYQDFYRPNGADSPIPGRPLAQFNLPWGYAGNHTYYNEGRSYGCSIGLKF